MLFGNGNAPTFVGFYAETNAHLNIENAAVRDAIFDPDTGFVKPLDTTTWSELGGVQPAVFTDNGDVVSNNLGWTAGNWSWINGAPPEGDLAGQNDVIYPHYHLMTGYSNQNFGDY